MTLFGSPGPADAVQRVVFVDKTVLDVEDAWRDDKYVHFVYQGRPITVLRSDVLRIEGSRPIIRPPAAPACPAPRPGDDDQAVRGYFRCLGVHWVRRSRAVAGLAILRARRPPSPTPARPHHR
jgi:hypothetical protein